MFRRCYDYMFDDLELNNYSRWLAASNPACYPMPDLSRVSRSSRNDIYSFDYPRHLYWMPQNWIFPSSERNFPRRDERRPHYSKGFHFARERRSNADERSSEHRFEKEDGMQKQFGRGKRGDTAARFDRRMQHPVWDKESIATNFHSQLHEDRTHSRLSHRSSCIDLCAEDFFASQGRNNSQAPSDFVTASSRECKEQKNFSANFGSRVSCQSFSENASDSRWKQQGPSASSSHLADLPGRESPKDFARSYDSWFCHQEQQQIVDTLKEVNLRHDRQLRRDMIVNRICSDDSVSSHVDSNSFDSFQKSLASSEDDEDNIRILLSPGGATSALEETNEDEEEQLKPSYLEKSASDFFQEFQSIFTVSPEKQIFNDLTKETLKDPTSDSGDMEAVRGRRISIEDKDAVRNSLKFEESEDEPDVFDSPLNSKPSSPEKVGFRPDKSSDALSEAGDIAFESAEKSACLPPSSDLLSKTADEKEISSADEKVCPVGNLVCVKHLEDIYGKGTEVETRFKGKEQGNQKTLAEPLPKTSGGQLRLHGHFGKRSDSNAAPSPLKDKFVKPFVNSSGFNKSHSQQSSVSAPDLKSYRQGHHQSPEKLKSKENKPWFRNNHPKAASGHQVCFSESYLDSRKVENVYRRISINEIFSSVDAESEKNKQILRQRQDYVNKMINEPNAKASMTPSAHLKLILGIGLENSNDTNRKDSKLCPGTNSTSSEGLSGLTSSDSIKVQEDNFDSLKDKISAEVSIKNKKHSYSRNRDRAKTDNIEAPTMNRTQIPSATSKYIAKARSEEQKPKSSKVIDEKTSEKDIDKFQNKDLEGCSVKATSELAGAGKYVSTPITSSSKCVKTSAQSDSLYDEVPNFKPSNKKQSFAKNSTQDCISEKGSVGNSKKEGNRKDSNKLPSKSDDRVRLPHENRAESTSCQETSNQSRQFSSKASRRFVCKVWPKFSRKSTYERGENYDNRKDNRADNQNKDFYGYQRDKWGKNRYLERNYSYGKQTSGDEKGSDIDVSKSSDAKDIGRRLDDLDYSVKCKISKKPSAFKVKEEAKSSERTDAEEACNSSKKGTSESESVSARMSDNIMKPAKDSSLKNGRKSYRGGKVKKSSKPIGMAKDESQESEYFQDSDEMKIKTTDEQIKVNNNRIRNNLQIFKPPIYSDSQTSKESFTSFEKVQHKAAMDHISKNIPPLAKSFISVSLEQQVVRQVVKDLEKTGCLVKKLKPDSKQYRDGKDRLTHRRSDERSFPSPQNQLFMDHVINQKLIISVQNLILRGESLPVIIVTMANHGKYGRNHQFVILEESVGKRARGMVRSLTNANKWKRDERVVGLLPNHSSLPDALHNLGRNMENLECFELTEPI